MIVGLVIKNSCVFIISIPESAQKETNALTLMNFRRRILFTKTRKKSFRFKQNKFLSWKTKFKNNIELLIFKVFNLSEKPVVCESSTTVITEYLTGETDKETDEEDKIYSPVLSSELEGSCESSAPVELQVAAHASISNESGWTRDNSKASNHNLRNTKYQRDKRQQYSPSHADAIVYFNFSLKMGQEMCKANPDMEGEKMQAIISKKWAVLPEKDKEKWRNSPKTNK